MPNHQVAQPGSLKVFFTTEMWERYGFYVVQTLLALFLVMHFQWGDHRVYFLVGSFTALTYLSPVVGGWIADHLLGQKRTILAGAVVLFLSYLALTLISDSYGLTLSLAGIAVGTGLLKPNISSLLGNEYPMEAPNRERGFTIFYLGIQAGIILGTTFPSYIQSYYGWPASFLSAAIGMIFAIIIFSYGIYHYRITDYHPYQHRVLDIVYAVLLVVGLWFGSFYILNHPHLADGLFIGIGLLSVVYMIASALTESPIQARQITVIGLLCIISVMFWAFYFQMFHSITLLLKRVASPSLFGIPFPPPYYVAVQSLGLIAFGVFLARNKKPRTLSEHICRVGNKFLLSMIFIATAYGLIALVCKANTDINLLSPLYFIPAFLMISLAELLLSPIGLSAVTMLASPKKVSTMMGIFFVSLGLGGFLSGKFASLTAISKETLATLSMSALKVHYANTFTHLFYILLAATLLCALLNRLIKHFMTFQDTI